MTIHLTARAFLLHVGKTNSKERQMQLFWSKEWKEWVGTRMLSHAVDAADCDFEHKQIFEFGPKTTGLKREFFIPVSEEEIFHQISPREWIVAINYMTRLELDHQPAKFFQVNSNTLNFPLTSMFDGNIQTRSTHTRLHSNNINISDCRN
ncbi:hypothetical protein T439DRAFT_32203 [Meredithblackwellia eburnea MCA 4105]